MRFSLVLALLIALCRSSANAATIVFEDGPFGWDQTRIVYAEVTNSDDMGQGTARVKLKVLATLAGRLDASAEAVIVSRIWYGFPETRVEKPPHVGSRCVTILCRTKLDLLCRNSPWHHTVYCAVAPLMPGQAYLVTVSGLDDPKVGQIISRLREIRASLWPTSDSRSPQAFDGSEAKLWDDHSVILAEVASSLESDLPGATFSRRRRATIALDIKATIAGGLDAALESHVPVRVAFGDSSTPIRALPKAKSQVVVVLRRMSDGRLSVSEDYFGFMPEKSPIAVVNGLDDPKVQEIVSRLRQLRQPVDKKGQ
jgi:hypothetical protein